MHASPLGHHHALLLAHRLVPRLQPNAFAELTTPVTLLPFALPLVCPIYGLCNLFHARILALPLQAHAARVSGFFAALARMPIHLGTLGQHAATAGEPLLEAALLFLTTLQVLNLRQVFTPTLEHPQGREATLGGGVLHSFRTHVVRICVIIQCLALVIEILEGVTAFRELLPLIANGSATIVKNWRAELPTNYSFRRRWLCDAPNGIIPVSLCFFAVIQEFGPADECSLDGLGFGLNFRARNQPLVLLIRVRFGAGFGDKDRPCITDLPVHLLCRVQLSPGRTTTLAAIIARAAASCDGKALV